MFPITSGYIIGPIAVPSVEMVVKTAQGPARLVAFSTANAVSFIELSSHARSTRLFVAATEPNGAQISRVPSAGR